MNLKMWVTDDIRAAVARWALILSLGAGIGVYKGCQYGEKRAYEGLIKEGKILVYNKENKSFYCIPLEQINKMIQDSNLEKIVKK